MRNRNLPYLILAALLAALTAVAAQWVFRLPGVPTVPVTLQVLVVFLAGALLGPVWGAVSMITYVLMGAIGLPVFALGKSGLTVLFGPTGGYLFSYPLAAAVIGTVAHPATAPKAVRTGIAMLAGLAIIYAGGGGWAILVGGKAFGVVLSGWVLPFVPFDLGKLVIAAALSLAVNRALTAQGYWARAHRQTA